MTTRPIFFTDPNDVPKRDTAQLVRTPHTGKLKAIITSNKILAAPTHYYSRRTVPCGGPGNCPICEAGHKWRLHGYLSILNLDNLAHQILELPARSYDAIAAWYRQFSTVRGLYIELTRPSQRPNGQIQLIVRKPQTIPETLPDPLPVQWLLCRIWGVTPPTDHPPKEQPRNFPTNNQSTSKQTEEPHNNNGNGTMSHGQSLTEALKQALRATQIPSEQ